MPYPDGYVIAQCGNRLVYSELDYNVVNEENVFQKNYDSMTGIFSLAKFFIKLKIHVWILYLST